MKRGATDFLAKPVAHEDLREVIRRAIETKRHGSRRAPAQPAAFPRRLMGPIRG